MAWQTDVPLPPRLSKSRAAEIIAMPVGASVFYAIGTREFSAIMMAVKAATGKSIVGLVTRRSVKENGREGFRIWKLRNV